MEMCQYTLIVSLQSAERATNARFLGHGFFHGSKIHKAQMLRLERLQFFCSRKVIVFI
jgi:hypothetical protein